jgi:arylsulfate sulfotransferase
MPKRSCSSTQAGFLCALTLALIASGCGASYRMTTQSPSVSITVTPARTAIATGATTRFSATGDPAGVTWSVANSTSGSTGAVGSIDASGNYTAPSGAQSVTVVVIATSKTDPAQSTLAIVNVVASGTVTNTNNVQVAQYTVSPAAFANVSVQFGLDTTYGLTTWTQPTPASGGAVSLYVAGMKAGTLYHMRGVVQFSDGTQFMDKDQTFTTGALPAAKLPNLAVTTAPGMTPQSGVEILNFAQTNGTTQFPLAVSDLNGNVLWAYDPGLPVQDVGNTVKLMSNGNFLINFSGPFTDGIDSEIREVDLAGNIVWDLTAAQLNASLAASTCAECNVTVVGTHHDFALLPNGHIILIASTRQTLSDGTMPLGDVIIDLDQNHNPVWAWNEFNHLDTNRRPYLYPDWTHSNAVIYSEDDGNLIISIRHQNWLVKIDYNNGHGAGDILWRLGYQGDFALLNPDGTADTNPTDWFYAQHGPSFPSATTSGRFPLILFDNGDDRGVSVVPGGTCGVTGQPACFSTVMLLQLDEAAKTATLSFHPTAADYSFFGGNAEVLKNGDVEYAEAAITAPANNAAVHEITQSSPPQEVWQMQITGQYAYRAMRLPSLYPGVQW